MSDKNNVDLLKSEKKRLSPDLLYNDEKNKRIKYEIGESSFIRPDIPNNIIQDDELLRKYQNISTRELENLCERLMYYDSTGIYIPPKDFSKKCECPNKKKEKRKKLTSSTNVTETKTTFGQGAVGVASNFGEKQQCSCCIDGYLDPRRHLPHTQPNFSGNSFSGIDMAGIPGTSGLSRSSEPFTDNLIDTSKVKNELSEILNQYSVMDLSINNQTESVIKTELWASDSSNTIYYTDDYEGIEPNSVIEPNSELNLPQVSELPLNLSNVSVQSETEVVNGENSVIPILDVTDTQPAINATVANNEVVDLTNASFSTPNRPINPNNEIIEILDSTFQTNLTPGVVVSIDLIDSDSDDDVISTNHVTSPGDGNGHKSFECPICFEPVKNKKIMSTICGHIFCAKCISNTMKTKKRCPTCRKRLKPSDVHPIYLNL